MMTLLVSDIAQMATPDHKHRDAQATRGLVALGVLVVALAGLVWWAAGSGKESSAPEGGAEDDNNVAAPNAVDASDGARAAARGTGTLERLPDASGELTILTARPDAEVTKIASAEALASALDVPYCGAACDAVKKLLLDPEHAEIEVLKGEDIILPPKEAIDTVAPGLSPAERASVHARSSAVIVRVRGEVTPEQIPARALFAAAARLADKLDGLVYDETTRRIENAAQTRQRTIKAPLGKPALSPRHIVIQFYRQPDGTARLVTLGMGRFGSPDLSIRGATMSAGAMLVDVVNAVASSIASGDRALPLTVLPADLGRDAGASIALHVADAPRSEGDPDNDVVDLVPPEGASRDAWDALVEKVFGAPAYSVERRFGPELEAAAERARGELPAVIRRFEGGEGELFVWAPFTIPDEEQADGGPEQEWLWVKVASCDARACTGTLSNRPMYASNIASGKTTSVARTKIADWLLRLSDGGVAGGKTTALLEKR